MKAPRKNKLGYNFVKPSKCKSKEVQKISLTCRAIFYEEEQYVSGNDIIDVVEIIQKNGGSIDDVLKLLRG